MNEKVRAPSPEPDNLQNYHSLPEDEVSLLDLLEVLVKKKVLIFSATAIFTLISIFYAFSVTPLYRAVISFQPPENRLSSIFPEFTFGILPDVFRNSANNYLLDKFLLKFQSYPVQEKVFNEGNFLQRFADESPDANMRKRIVQQINRSIHISRGGEGKKRVAKGSSSQTVTIVMEGAKPEVISDFLNALADRSKNEVVISVKESMQYGIELLQDKYSIELERVNTKVTVEKANKVRLFSENLEIAKNLGVLDNNFGGSAANPALANAALLFAEGPIWYLYGQRALEQELKMLERGGVSSQFVEEIAELDYKLAYLAKIDLSKINFEPVIISQFSIPPVDPINLKNIEIITLGITLGLFIGIVMAFLSHLVEQLKKRSDL